MAVAALVARLTRARVPTAPCGWLAGLQEVLPDAGAAEPAAAPAGEAAPAAEEPKAAAPAGDAPAAAPAAAAAAGAPGLSEAEKIKLRKERFGLQAGAEGGKAGALAPLGQVDIKEELERRKKRAERFGIPVPVGADFAGLVSVSLEWGLWPSGWPFLKMKNRAEQLSKFHGAAGPPLWFQLSNKH